MSNYEPTIAQAVFETKWQKHDAEELSDDLYKLSEALARRDPDAQCHGFLGGSYGYGQHFRNEVFEMHPYYWGDCACGFDARDEQWSRDNLHASGCCQAELKAEERQAGFTDPHPPE